MSFSLGLQLKKIQKKTETEVVSEPEKIENPMVLRQRKRANLVAEFKKLKNFVIEEITQGREPSPCVLVENDETSPLPLNNPDHVDYSVWRLFENWCFGEGLAPVLVEPDAENPCSSVVIKLSNYRSYLQ